MLLELTLRNSKRLKDLVQPHQSATSLIMHILDHIKERILAQLIQYLSVSSNTILRGPVNISTDTV